MEARAERMHPGGSAELIIDRVHELHASVELVAFRLNQLQATVDDLQRMLRAHGVQWEIVNTQLQIVQRQQQGEHYQLWPPLPPDVPRREVQEPQQRRRRRRAAGAQAAQALVRGADAAEERLPPQELQPQPAASNSSGSFSSRSSGDGSEVPLGR